MPCARHFICRRHTIEFAAGHVIKFPVQLYGCTAMIICFLHPYPKQRHTASSDTLSPRRAGSQLSWLYRWPLNIGSGKSAQRLGIWCSENKGYGIYITAIRSASSITTNIVTEKIAVNALMIFSSSCDCPLDSIIIKKAHINDCVWSKLTEQQYLECQAKITELLNANSLDLELSKLGNLAYDFVNW